MHPSLLPRWRGAAPIERAIMAGDEETGVSIMRLTAGLDSGPGLPAGARADPARRRLRHALGAPGARSAATCSSARSTSARRSPSRTRPGVTYAHKIEARDRALDLTRPPEEVERVVRALRPHIGARLPLPDGAFLGVLAARVDGDDAGAGRRPRARGRRAAAARLQRRRARADSRSSRPAAAAMAAADWLRGRPDPRAHRLLARPAAARRARSRSWSSWPISEWRSDAEWAPYLAALA